MHRTLEKIQKRCDIDINILKHFDMEEPKFDRLYILPKIHKRMHSNPGIPVISNSGFYAENISAFLDFHLKPTAAKVNLYIKHTDDFLRKFQNLPKLPDGVILYTIDVVGLYPIPMTRVCYSLKKH